MNLYKVDVKNKNTNLYCRFYILFIHNQTKTTKKLIKKNTVSDCFHHYPTQSPPPRRNSHHRGSPGSCGPWHPPYRGYKGEGLLGHAHTHHKSSGLSRHPHREHHHRASQRHGKFHRGRYRVLIDGVIVGATKGIVSSR
jgi:hypothetical protein